MLGADIMTSDYTEVNGRVVKCWYEIGSMYFDAPESITLVLEGCSALSSDHSQNVFNLYRNSTKYLLTLKLLQPLYYTVIYWFELLLQNDHRSR